MVGPDTQSRRIGLDARLYAGDHTGIGIYTRSLIDGLAFIDKHNRYYLFTDRPLKGPAENFTVCRLSSTKRFLWTQLFLPPEIKKMGLDLYHGTANHEVPLMPGSPFVVTIHDLIPLIFPGTVPLAHRLLFRTFISPAIRRARLVITDSDFVRESLVQRFGLDVRRVFTVPLAHGPEFSGSAPVKQLEEVRKKYGLRSPFILYVGAMEPRKNLPALISAFTRAVSDADLREWQLVLAGGGGWHKKETMKAVADAELGDRLVVTGFVPGHELPALYQQAALFVYPSIYEGFGLPVLEAMASGVPVLVSSPSALEELAGEAGASFMLSEPDDLHRQMVSLMRDEGRRADLTAAGRARASFYSWDRCARMTLDLYRQAIGRIGGD